MIPRIIHQLWIGPYRAPTDMMKTWRELHPDWEYMFWDETALSRNFPGGLKNQLQFDQMSEWNGKCDIARYEILSRFGGVFVDADAVCLRPLDHDFLNRDSFSCYESEQLRGPLIAAGYLGCVPTCELMDHLIHRIGLHKGRKLGSFWAPAWLTTGPYLLTRTVQELEYAKLTIYPSHYFIPHHHTGLCSYEGAFKPYADQKWGSTLRGREESRQAKIPARLKHLLRKIRDDRALRALDKKVPR